MFALVAAFATLAAPAPAQDPSTPPFPAPDEGAPLPTLDRTNVVDLTAEDRVRVRWETPDRAARPGEAFAVALVVDLDRDALARNLVQPFTRRLDAPIAVDAPDLAATIEDAFGVPDDEAGGGDRVAFGGVVVRADESYDVDEDGRAWRRLRLYATVSAALPGALELAAPVARFVTAETFREELLGRVPVDARIAFVRGAAARVEVAGFPEDGRSPDFDGLVGSFDLQVTASPAALAVGDTLRVEVDVAGPVPAGGDTLPRFDRLRGLHQVSRRVDATERGARVTLEYRVERAVDAFPSLELHSFVPSDARYAVARSASVPLRVSAARASEATDAAADGGAPGTSASTDGSSPAVWIAGAVAGVLAGLAVMRSRARRAR